MMSSIVDAALATGCVIGLHPRERNRFPFAEVMLMGLPLPVLLQDFCDTPGEKNVPGVPAIHCRCAMLIPAPAIFERSLTSVNCPDRTAVNTHPHANFRIIL